jgi:HAD superfamily hydrolase (TIGR01509 family)
MMHKTGVIFDMDGVIVDTVSALYQIYLSILFRYGIEGSQSEFNELNGPSLQEISELLCSRHQSIPTPEVLTNDFELAHNKLYENIALIPDVIKVLQELKSSGVKIGLASSSNRRNINIIFKRFDLESYFHFTISGDEVSHAKPNPEIYRLAADKLNVQHIYAVDDSFHGIESALQAGISTIQFTKDNPVINQNTSYKIDKLKNIPNILKSPCQLLGRYNNFEFTLVDFDLSPYLKVIDDYWSKYKSDTMTNNDAYLYLKVIGNHIEVVKSTYKTVYYILQNPDSTLAKVLFPIGVSGFILDKNNHILLAKRSSFVTQYKNFYECPPSGSIECIDTYQNQILIELEEEVDIMKKDVASIKTIALLKDKNTNQFDIFCKINLESNIQLHIKNNTEYSCFTLVPTKELNNFITMHSCIPETSVVNLFFNYNSK